MMLMKRTMRNRSASPEGSRCIGVAIALLLLAGCARDEAPLVRVGEHWDMLDRYCSDCHNDAEFSGELSFDGVGPEEIAATPAIWENVARKLRGDLMPPPGEPRPETAEILSFVSALEDTLDALIVGSHHHAHKQNLIS